MTNTRTENYGVDRLTVEQIPQVAAVLAWAFQDDSGLTTITAHKPTTYTITDADAFVATLKQQFDLQVPQAAALWPGIWLRHQQWLSEQRVLTSASAPKRKAEQF